MGKIFVENAPVRVILTIDKCMTYTQWRNNIMRVEKVQVPEVSRGRRSQGPQAS